MSGYEDILWKMNHGQKKSAQRAYYSEFDGIVNPNEKSADIILAVLAPCAAAAVILAVAGLIGGMSPAPLVAITLMVYAISLKAK